MKELYDISKTVEKLSRRLKVHIGGLEATPEDSMYFVEVLALRISLLQDLSVYSTFSDDNCIRLVTAYRRTLLSLNEIDVKAYSEQYKRAREAFLIYLNESRYATRDWNVAPFKRECPAKLKWIWQISQTLWVCTHSEYAVNQWLSFDRKINFRGCDYRNDNATAWLNTELRIRRTGHIPNDILEELRNIAMHRYYKFSIELYEFRPGHGNGASAELSRVQACLGSKERSVAFTLDEKAYLGRRLYCTILNGMEESYPTYVGDKVTVFDVVPKSPTTNRTIGKERCSLIYLQTDVARALDDYFERWIPQIRLHDQSLNARGALDGSVAGSYATLDLSEASDSVTKTHIRQVFGDLPLGRTLLSLMSDFTDIKSDNICGRFAHEKYASMGNRLCFPAMCALLDVICAYAVESILHRHPQPGDYQIYGDDIIIRNECAEFLCSTLTACGFLVNEGKSFLSSTEHPCFRESCGVEAYAGKLITPVCLSRRLHSIRDLDNDLYTRDNPEAYATVVALCNNLYDASLFYTRKAVYDLIPQMWYKVYTARAAEEDATVLTMKTFPTCCTNYNVRTRYNRDLQRLEGRCTTLISNTMFRIEAALASSDDTLLDFRRRHLPENAEYEYYSWFSARGRGGESMPLVYRPVVDRKLTLRYNPVEIS